MRMASISTPCVQVCMVDGSIGICIGCGRTSAEITAWGRLSEPERQAVMSGLAARMEAAGLSPPRTLE